MTRWLLGATLSASSMPGCGGTGDSGSFSVVLLGDASRVEALSELSGAAPGSVSLSTPGLSSDVRDVADDARNADMVLIVTNATEGPTPIVREHVLLARQLRIPTVGLLISRTDELLQIMEGDAELLDLVELELRELLSTYELAGDTAPRFYDSESFDASSGPTAFAEAIAAGGSPRRSPSVASVLSGSTLDSEIYLLTELEASAVRSIARGSSISIWIDGVRASGEADLTNAIRPGDASSLRIRLGSSLASSKGARFFIERDGRLVGVGTVVALE